MTYKIYSRLYESAKNCRDLESFIANNPSIHLDDLKAIYLFASNPIKSSISAANMSQRDFAAEYGRGKARPGGVVDLAGGKTGFLRPLKQFLIKFPAFHA